MCARLFFCVNMCLCACLCLRAYQCICMFVFPNISVWGSCFWLCAPGCLRRLLRLYPPPLLLLSSVLAHTTRYTQLGHAQHTHIQLVTCSHTTCPHIAYSNRDTHRQLDHADHTHIQLSLTRSLSTHNILKQPIYLEIYVPNYLSVYICLSMHLSVYLSVCLSICLSLSIFLVFVYMYIYLCIHP